MRIPASVTPRTPWIWCGSHRSMPLEEARLSRLLSKCRTHQSTKWSACFGSSGHHFRRMWCLRGECLACILQSGKLCKNACIFQQMCRKSWTWKWTSTQISGKHFLTDTFTPVPPQILSFYTSDIIEFLCLECYANVCYVAFIQASDSYWPLYSHLSDAAQLSRTIRLSTYLRKGHLTAHHQLRYFSCVNLNFAACSVLEALFPLLSYCKEYHGKSGVVVIKFDF